MIQALDFFTKYLPFGYKFGVFICPFGTLESVYQFKGYLRLLLFDNKEG